MTALYNELDPYAADWLENLIAEGLIAPGIVDRRSIVDIRPSDLQGFRQVHFFAGLGLWSRALRNAGVADSTALWTGSCPCQPFSAAGKGGGFDDERHLWPHFHYLIEQCRPPIVLGEQVASKDGLAWFDLVQSDLEGTGYAAAAIDSCSAGFGAPHIRQRLYWMAYADDQGGSGRRVCGPGESHSAGAGAAFERSTGLCSDGIMEHTVSAGPQGHAGYGDHRDQSGRDDAGADRHAPATSDAFDQLADTSQQRHGSIARGVSGVSWESATERDIDLQPELGGATSRLVETGHNGDPGLERPSPTNGFWSNPDWIYCRDGKWRPVEPGTFPLAHGLPRSMGTGGAELQRLASVAALDAKSLARAKAYRIGALRGYGNAINLEHATEFCRAAFG